MTVVAADPVNEIIGIATVEGGAGLVTRIAEETATVGEIREAEAGLVRIEIAGGTVGGRAAETGNEMSGGVTGTAADQDLAKDTGTEAEAAAEVEAVMMIARMMTDAAVEVRTVAMIRTAGTVINERHLSMSLLLCYHK